MDDEFDRLFMSVVARLRSRVAVLVGSRPMADDLIQDVYVRLRGSEARWRRFVGHPNPYGYALATAVNLARARWRVEWRWVPFEEVMAPLSDGGMPAAESRQDLTHLLRSLTAKEAAVVVLVDLDGHTLDEAAALLGVHKGTAHRNRLRALAKLRTHFTEPALWALAPTG
ncbi:RNA polymerase sigma factor [Actinokineospora iranica]|uniref:RNA polymerase sigma-70 factor, ECF subfamily n=1 Tax=Actinokineospora iranica TaxID=1271860 RepID=A0A1G6ZFV2_9PSEU|nr:RNA polymerase sigma factor [Actinokineospora iranica]SDE01564.1 RNA polymerase sigma-70 factor, ECF subfamily [Actinokineospora iranica]